LFPGEAVTEAHWALWMWLPPFSFRITGFTGSMMNEVGSMCDRKLRLLIDPFNMFSCDEWSCA
jgi:hypothetical protein